MLTSDDVAAIQLPITPGVRALREYIANRWNVSVVAPRGASIRRPARNAAGELRRRDVHEEGRAIDVMVRDRAQGEQIANWLASNAFELGIQYMIWDRLELSSSTVGPAWEPYGTSGDRAAMGRTPNPHTDHVHVELTPRTAADGAAMRARLGMPATADANASQAITSSSGRGSSSTPGADVERTREFTGPRPFELWAASRFELLYLTLRDLGLPVDESLHTARAVLALWITETGWQESPNAGESNFNAGNITGASPYGFFRIAGNTRRFRAYADDTDGVRDAVVVLSTGRYRAAWEALVVGGDPVEWYSAILRAGYTGWAQGLVDTFASVLRRIPQRLTR
jgi:hypothetical protein